VQRQQQRIHLIYFEHVLLYNQQNRYLFIYFFIYFNYFNSLKYIDFLTQHYTSIAQAVRSIYEKEGGMRGFYRGLWPAIIQIMPYMGLLFASYDAFAAGFKKLRVKCLQRKPFHFFVDNI
jgi:hypothetical protein